MPHPSKVKGNSFEREIVRIAQERGLNARRAYASNGEALGHHKDVDLLISGRKVQAKRRKKLASYLQPGEHVDAQIFREDRGVPLVLITLDEYLRLLQGEQA